MSRTKRVLIFCLFTILLAVLALPSLGADAAPALKCGQWSLVPTATTGHPSSILEGVAASAANDVWQVGYNIDRHFRTINYTTLTEHWNGSKWGLVPSVNPTGMYDSLFSVTAVSANDVWAVGGSHTFNNSNDNTLIEHWNGTQWNVDSNTLIPGGLNAVAAVSANDVWAVGATDGTNYKPFAEHWDGTQWSVVSVPTKSGTTGVFTGLTIVSTSNIWAVGYLNGSNSKQTLIEHWNGTQWSIINSPNSTSYNFLLSAAAVSANDIWAVGYTASGTSISMHWDGKQWSLVNTPSQVDSLEGVTALASNNIWAVGSQGGNQTLAMQWNGTQWNVANTPNKSSQGNNFFGVTHVPGSGQIWAVGKYDAPKAPEVHILTESYC